MIRQFTSMSSARASCDFVFSLISARSSAAGTVSVAETVESGIGGKGGGGVRSGGGASKPHAPSAIRETRAATDSRVMETAV